MTKWKICFTEKVKNLVMDYNGHDESTVIKYIDALWGTIQRIPPMACKIDASDDAISFNGTQLSFMRNWEENTAVIMTAQEVKRLDYVAADYM